MSAAPRLVHTHLLPPARPCVSAPEATPCAVNQSKKPEPVNQTSQLASRTASHHPVASLHHGGCPPGGFKCLFARAASPSRSQAAAGLFPIRNPISIAACRMRTPDESKDQHQDAVGRRRADLTAQQSRAAAARANITRVCHDPALVETHAWTSLQCTQSSSGQTSLA